ncbi:S1C family serine protease [Cytobacillus sp. Hm23]
MGYYDDGYVHLQKRYKRKRKKKGWLLTVFIGAVVGTFIVIMFIPLLAKLDVLPYKIVYEHEKIQSPEEIDSVSVTAAPSRNMTVNVITSITEAVEKVSEAVVGVVNIQEANFWSSRGPVEAGTGSGVIYKKDNDIAYIVTNHHVVEQANNVEVVLYDGTRVNADIVGTDALTDLAVLKIDAKDITVIAELGDSDQVKTGETVIAIGNPLGIHLSGSVTKGIISGTNRFIPVEVESKGRIIDWFAEVLQTDAAINPGNSGGALVDMNGKVIGINSMKIARHAVEGIGLSIPINYVQQTIENLEMNGEIRRPYMGVELTSLQDIPVEHLQKTLKLPTEVTKGVAITGVERSSPADEAGMQELDVIVELDGEPINDLTNLRRHLYTKKSVGDTMEVTLFRQGLKQTITMKLSKYILL